MINAIRVPTIYGTNRYIAVDKIVHCQSTFW